MSQDLRQLGDELARAVAAAAPAVIHIERGRGVGATGFAVTSELAVSSSAALVGDSGEVLVGEDRREAAVVGRDPGTDVALLRISGGGMRAPSKGDLDRLQVGHLALALGRPGASVRASLSMVGAIAGEIRTPSGGRLDRYIEIDRRLPAGFSGGPLIDADGAVIGMNTRGLIRGASVVVPIETIARVVTELEKHGAIRTGYLGVRAVSVRLPSQLSNTRSQRRGALVVSVADGSPAEAAGLVLGDVIVAAGADPVEDPMDLRAALTQHAGDAVTLAIVRAGALTDVDVTLGERSGA